MNILIRFALLFLVACLAISACAEKPPTPVPTADISEDTIIEELYDKVNDPGSTHQVISALQGRTVESQKIIVGRYIDGYLQRGGFGLGPERMELLKGLLAMYYYGLDVVDLMEIDRELPVGGSIKFAYLPERTIVVIADEIVSMWAEKPPLEFADALANVFLDAGFDTDYLNAFIRSMEVRDFLARLERSQSEAVSGAEEPSLDEYVNANLGLSIKYPNDWTIEEIQGGFGLFDPPGSTVVAIIRLGEESVPAESVAVFLQNAREGNPNLAAEDSQFSTLIQEADEVDGQRIISNYSYPSGVEIVYYADIVVVNREGASWLLLVTSDKADQDFVELLNEMMASFQF